MRYLVTLKPEKYLTPHHAYAVLAEVDWQSKQVLREIRFPTATYSNPKAFMSPLIGGVCQVGQSIYVAMWNYIVHIDYPSFAIINSFSHPYMADLHGITSDGAYLYVTATAIDAVLCFDINSLELVWRWGPDEPILYQERVEQQLQQAWTRSVPILHNAKRDRVTRQQTFFDKDYRFRHKKYTGYHHHHVNDVILREKNLYITTKQWNTHLKGAIILLDLDTHESTFFVGPDNLDGLHDGVWYDGQLFVTESGANQVAWCDGAGHVTHQRIEPAPYFVRGLCDTGESWLVGFSTLRNTALPAQIIEYNRDFTTIMSTMDVSHFYPDDKQTTIHSIYTVPSDRN